MKEKHANELAENLDDSPSVAENAITGDDKKKTEGDANPTQTLSQEKDTGKPKKTKAQRKREKAREKERQREIEIENEKKNAGPSPRDYEIQRMNELNNFKEKKLEIMEVPADGNCLYRYFLQNEYFIVLSLLPLLFYVYVSNTVSALNSEIYRAVASFGDESYKAIREICADTLLSNKDDFAPFIAAEQMMAEESQEQVAFEDYVDKVRSSCEWVSRFNDFIAEYFVIIACYFFFLDILTMNFFTGRTTGTTCNSNRFKKTNRSIFC